MKVGALEETITVTGATPIVDTQNVAKIATASREVMDVLPTDRNFVSFAALTPSVLVTGVRQNVGGSIPETGMNLVVHGSRASDSLVMVDGMPIINGSGSGGLQYGNYLNNALAQEITFQTDSHNAEFERASVYSNFIPKEGSNTFRGSFAARYAGEGWQSANLDDDAAVAGLTSGNRINRDLGPQPGARRPDRQGPRVDLRLVPPLGHLQHGGRRRSRTQDFSELFYQPSHRAEPVPGVAPERGGPPDDADQPEEQGQPLLRLAVHLLRQLLRADLPDRHQRLPGVQEHPAVHRAGRAGARRSPTSCCSKRARTVTPQDFHGYRRPGVSDRPSSRSTTRWRPPAIPTTWGSSATGYGANRSTSRTTAPSASYVTGIAQRSRPASR